MTGISSPDSRFRLQPFASSPACKIAVCTRHHFRWNHGRGLRRARLSAVSAQGLINLVAGIVALLWAFYLQGYCWSSCCKSCGSRKASSAPHVLETDEVEWNAGGA